MQTEQAWYGSASNGILLTNIQLHQTEALRACHLDKPR